MRVLDEEQNPYVGDLLARVRSVELQRDRACFRAALRGLGTILAYEISKTLPAIERPCRTPLGTRTERVLGEMPVLVTIMRASIPMWEGMLEVFDRSESIIVGAARREGSISKMDAPALEVDLGYTSWSSVEGRTLVYVDPMIATGSTLRLIHEALLSKAGRPRRVVVAGVIGYRKTARAFEAPPFCADVFLASADDELDERGYIVPGLGDAGDLAFGSKL
jgi:uracil phosphoribosyltransferase